MPKAYLTPLIAACLFLAVGCQSAGSLREGESLRQAGAEWDRIFNSGDAAKLAALYAEDAVSEPPNNPTVQGRAAIQKEFEGFFATNVARHETKVDDLIVSGDLAIEAAHYRLTVKPKAGGTETVETGRHVECRRCIGGKWQIVLELWNLDTPAPK